jgi:hypothetical protein
VAVTSVDAKLSVSLDLLQEQSQNNRNRSYQSSSNVLMTILRVAVLMTMALLAAPAVASLCELVERHEDVPWRRFHGRIQHLLYTAQEARTCKADLVQNVRDVVFDYHSRDLTQLVEVVRAAAEDHQDSDPDAPVVLLAERLHVWTEEMTHIKKFSDDIKDVCESHGWSMLLDAMTDAAHLPLPVMNLPECDASASS